MTSGISVVVCTYNGAGRIGPTLEALTQCVASFPVEVVLVDNNSDDGTAHVAQDEWARLGRRFPLRLVREPQAGLAFARRAGVSAAKEDIIVFCDDDNRLAEDYLTEAMAIMQEPSIGALGGAGTPIFEDELVPPPHFYNFASWLACGAQLGLHQNVSKDLVDLTSLHGAALFGAGLVVRRSDMTALFDLPDFPLLSDRKGAMLSSAGDYEICHLLALMGKRLLYSPRLSFGHVMPAGRLEPTYLARLASSNAHLRTIKAYVAARQLRASERWTLSIVKDIAKLLMVHRRDASRFNLALWLDAERIACPEDRPAFRNIRAAKRMQRGGPIGDSPRAARPPFGHVDREYGRVAAE